MTRAVSIRLDPYIVALIATVGVASLLPCKGIVAAGFQALTTAAIALLFFLHGAKLARSAVIAGLINWRLHLLTLAVTYIAFPLLGLLASHAPGLSPAMARGLLFLTLLPSTVQSSVAFTSVAGGDVAAAVCGATLSNLLGIVLTPSLVAVTIGAVGRASDPVSSIEAIALQLLLPFLLGHLSRPTLSRLLDRHKGAVTLVDRGSILLVVYTAFSAAVVEGLWHQVSTRDLALVVLIGSLLLATVLAITAMLGRLVNLQQPQRIVLQFCGSKKSLASGVPMASVLFPTAQVGPVILPLMIFHQLQLIVCAWLAQRYKRSNVKSRGGR